MISRKNFHLTDGLLVTALFLCAGAELITRELFHRVSAEASKLIILAILCILFVGFFLVFWRLLSSDPKRIAGRFAVMVATCVAVIFEFPKLGTVTSEASISSIWLLIFIVILIGGVVILALAASDAMWSKFRLLTLIIAITFATSQPILVATFAPHIQWPPIATSQNALKEQPKGKTLTVFLLLDELNAQAATPIVAILKEQGLQVRAKSIVPVADATGKVIPALFTGKDFSDAKPCGPTATCSGSNILDFSRIESPRPDVDVVGFSHPYCAIQGLRFCYRSVVAHDPFDLERWRCRLWRRTGYPRGTTYKHCAYVFRKEWAAMTENVIHAMWLAPAWQKGGFLFAHLPLPHPPGNTDTGSLQTHYSENLIRTYGLVQDILHKIQESQPDSFRLVIFSDHPLRQSMWCSTQWMYSSQGCTPSPEFEDNKVPLIVAGSSLPDINDIVKNDQIFELVSR